MKQLINKLKNIWASCQTWEYTYQMRNNEFEIHKILDAMGIQYQNTIISGVVFSDILKYVPVHTLCRGLGINKKGTPIVEDEKLLNPKELLNEDEEILDDPDEIISDPDIFSGSKVLILGEYYPSQKIIVLYNNAIIYHIATTIYKQMQTKTYRDRFKDIEETYLTYWLNTGLSAVYAHEYFHAVHHQNGDFNNADDLLKESMAEYFELLYCDVYPNAPASISKKYVGELRGWLKQCPYDFIYRGALAFDKMLGEKLPEVLRAMILKGSYCMPIVVYDIVDSQYKLFQSLFVQSNFCGYFFGELYNELSPILHKKEW